MAEPLPNPMPAPAPAPLPAPKRGPAQPPVPARPAEKPAASLSAQETAVPATVPARVSAARATGPTRSDEIKHDEIKQKGVKEGTEEGTVPASRLSWIWTLPSWLTSLMLHFLVILILALMTVDLKSLVDRDLTLGVEDALVEEDLASLQEQPVSQVDVNLEATSADSVTVEATDAFEEIELVETTALADAAPAAAMELSPLGMEAASSDDLRQEVGAFQGTGLEGRSASERTRLVREAGGTAGSEEAVRRALVWLTKHQMPDGGWSFFHQIGGRCNCPNNGEMGDARIGATAMALLPFLGAGNTHREGEYQTVVNQGLYFLLTKQQSNGSLWEEGGSMYSHGLASIVLCEAYAMTHDQALQKPAQAALNFIAYAQDPVTFGWRYKPRDMTGGDTSVVGWQLMALKSGHMASLYVNPGTVAGASRFLDSVQANKGATYGYMAPGERPATSAIGLLCRMYLGWDKEHEALMEGVKRISKTGPSDANMYFNYYATQVLRHYEGELWTKWNDKMRDFLVKTQERKGHLEGSWVMGKEQTDKGGRLYCTSMATMILEVYYRHMPIYGKQASDVEFKL